MNTKSETTTNVYGLRRANRTIHILCFPPQEQSFSRLSYKIPECHVRVIDDFQKFAGQTPKAAPSGDFAMEVAAG
jgi:hypothetical protein